MMSAPTITPYVVGVAAAGLVYAVLKRQAARGSLPLPPGPRPLPVIGNLLDIPREKEWLTYRDWHERYGDVVYIEALGQKIVILGSLAVVNDLMEKRGAMYSDRPSTVMLNELMEGHWVFSMLPYGEHWRRSRKLFHAHVHQGVVHQYHPVQLESARRLARDILATKTDKEALPAAVKANFGRFIIKMVYGIDAADSNSEYLTLPQKVLDDFDDACTPGRFLVDFFPILKHVPAWFPGAGFQRHAQRAKLDQRRLRDKPMEFVVSEMANGTALPSMAQFMLEENSALPAEQSQVETIKDVAAVTYLAGSDTTVAAVVSFFLAMLVYPDVQAKAQAEVDRVVGKDRLPELEDADNMPYVQAIASECLRWLPVAPTGLAHSTPQDDEYNGYLIPKGSIVMGSVWSILHDPEDYPDPDTFKPERYLTPEGKLDPNVRDPRVACFGFGRRICPGRHLADASLFTMIATLLATVDLVRAKDAQGHEIVPDVEVTSGLLSHAKPFPWDVRSRGPQAEALIANALVH